MRLTRPPTLLTLLSTLLTCTHALPANPDDSTSPNKELLEARYHYLSGRSCPNPCGWSGQVCCSSSQTCSTNSAGEAVCSGSSEQQADVSDGQWEFFTTTIYVESDIATYTSVYSSLIASAAPAAAAISSISCNGGLGESPCGTLCCATGQYCLYAGQCAASSNNLLESVSSSIQAPAAPTPSSPPASEPLRPTVNAATTVTSTGSATATVRFLVPSAASPSAASASASSTALPGVNAASTNNGLSAGAIAGIVIGVLAGLFFLFIICAILCCKGLIDGILDFFGLRSRRRKETYIEEEHRHQGRTWYGRRRPVEEDVVVKKKKTGGWGSIAGFAAALGVFAAVLGLRRRSERRRSEKAASRYTESTYDDYYSDTSPSSVSSDRRTRPSRRTETRETEVMTRKSSRR